MNKCGAEMTCSSSGDPHMHMFYQGSTSSGTSSSGGHPQGVGPYVMAQSIDKKFIVQVCHSGVPKTGHVSVNTAMAVKSPWGIVKRIGGSWVGANTDIKCSAETCHFPDGEVVSMRGSTVWVRFPAKYCGNVQGMCGNYSPEKDFSDAYSDANGNVVSLVGQKYKWGGPFWGPYQAKFVESFKATTGAVVTTTTTTTTTTKAPTLPTTAKMAVADRRLAERDYTEQSLFTDSECKSVEEEPPAVIKAPYADCPELEIKAIDECPAGVNYENCLMDVGETCNLDRWTQEAQITPPTDFSTNSPTAFPTPAPPTPPPPPTPAPCTFNTCSKMKTCDARMRCTSGGDPHVRTFSGKATSPQGAGPYVLAKSMGDEKDLTVQVCHRVATGRAAVNSAIAINSKFGVIKFIDGNWILPKDSDLKCSGLACTLPSGESFYLSARAWGYVVSVDLPAGYCGAVEGLCGRYNPDASFSDVFSSASGSLVGGEELVFGSVFGGNFQKQFAESFKVSAADSLFEEEECPIPAAAPYVPPTAPYAKCPNLEAVAKMKCPKGPNYNNCLIDVGFTCDLSTWVKDAMTDGPPAPVMPTPPPTPSPTAFPTPSPTPSCSFNTCSGMNKCGAQMTCSSSGDPHTHMFSGKTGHPQGHGPYVLAQSADKNFVVQTCHQRINSRVSRNSGMAVKSKWGLIKHTSGCWTGASSRIKCSCNTCTFPDGAVVAREGGSVWVRLPSTYCGQVSGMCGNYSPEKGFSDAYTNAEGVLVELTHGHYAWGGPFWGAYQTNFVDSFKAKTYAESFFSPEECEIGAQTPPAVLPVPYADCPSLEAKAVEQCPQGARYEDCLADVGWSCNLNRWVAEAQIEPPLDFSTNSPTAFPTPRPIGVPVPTKFPTPAPCTFNTCAEMETCGARMRCTSGGDPHMRMFSGMVTHPQGIGPYMLAKSKSVQVQVCHLGSASSSYNGAIAVKYAGGVLKWTDGHWHVPKDSGITCSRGTCTLPSGETIYRRGRVVSVDLPASNCGKVEGLCGAYNPDVEFADTLTTAEGKLMRRIGTRWVFGGMFGGSFQQDFVDSYKITLANSLFSESECPVPAPTPYVEPAAPYTHCPMLEAIAHAKCPKGDLYDNCVMDVGMTCDLSTWVDDALAGTPDLPPRPTPPPTPSPPTPAPTPDCTWNTCSGMHSCDGTMSCRSSGDPHVHMFSSDVGHPMGEGSYILAQSMNNDFEVQVCHKPLGNGISYVSGVAVRSEYGTFKHFAKGGWIGSTESKDMKCSFDTCTFPNGEKVAWSRNSVYVTLPARYCGNVQGLCGRYQPKGNFADAFTSADGTIADFSTQKYRWGGPFQGNYQDVFAESFKTTYSKARGGVGPYSLFEDHECSWAPPTPAPAVRRSYEKCPSLFITAVDVCPKGPRYNDCLFDVGETCDLARWVADAKIEPPLDYATRSPTPSPTPAPPTPPPAPTPPPCLFNTCATMKMCQSHLHCSSNGDPHVTMFSGKKTMPQGVGSYVLARKMDKSFTVHACHKRAGARVSTNSGVAVYSKKYGTFKYLNGAWRVPAGENKDVVCTDHKCEFPGGEVVAMVNSLIQVKLPANEYCGQVEGLCGRFNPDDNYHDSFTNAMGKNLNLMRQSHLNNKPFWGQYQTDFADSFLVKADASEALFTEDECPSTSAVTAPGSGMPRQPFANCPDLRMLAEMQCPRGENYADCVSDAGFTCDVEGAVEAWTTKRPLGERPTPPPTPPPTEAPRPVLPAGDEYCDMVFCRHEEHKCSKYNRDKMTWAAPSMWISELTEIELMDQPHRRSDFDSEECNGGTRRSVRVYHHRDETRCTKQNGGHRCGVGLVTGDKTKCECGPKFSTKALHYNVQSKQVTKKKDTGLHSDVPLKDETELERHERLFMHSETDTPMRDFKGGYVGDRPTHLKGGYSGALYNSWGCNIEGQRLSLNSTVNVVFDHVPRGWCRRFPEYKKTTQKNPNPCKRFHDAGGHSVAEFGGAAVKLFKPTTVGVLCSGAGARGIKLFQTDGPADQSGEPWDANTAVYWHEAGNYSLAGVNAPPAKMQGFESTVPAGSYTVCCTQSDDTVGFTSGAFTSDHKGKLKPLFTTLLHPDKGTMPTTSNVVTYRNKFYPDKYIAGGKGSADEKNAGRPWKRGDYLYWDTTAVGRANLDGKSDVAHPKIIGCEDKLWASVGTKKPFYECVKYFNQTKA